MQKWQIIELADKIFVIAIIMFNYLKENMDTINTEMEDFKRTVK